MLDRDKCVGCGACLEVCTHSQPGELGGALSLPTKEIECEALFELVRPQLEMFKNNGGITLSGGEALLQAEEVKRLLILCKQHGISTCVESSFTLPEGPYRMVSEYTDYWLAGMRDIKFGMGDEKNDKEVVEKIKLVSLKAKKIIARYPLIGGYTTQQKQLDRYRLLMAAAGIHDIELMKCNPNMLHYYQLSGMNCGLSLTDILTTEEQWQEAQYYFMDHGFHVTANE